MGDLEQCRPGSALPQLLRTLIDEFAFRRISRIDVRVLPIQIEYHWQDTAASTSPPSDSISRSKRTTFSVHTGEGDGASVLSAPASCASAREPECRRFSDSRNRDGCGW